MQLKPGSTLQNGKYKIIKTLGQGGFGITYLAEQVALGRIVAVKEFFMKDCCERQADTSFVSVPTQSNRALVEKFCDKFIREAKMIASFDHRHIVRVTDVFNENGTAYYVMDNLPGGSLADKVKREGPLSEEQAEKYIRQVSDALAFIHSQNTVHLDIKPSNILLNAKDEAVLIDFGIAKHYDQAGEQTSSTPVGISKGYAPLEQSRNGDVSQFKPSTDLYALGATLYFLSTGSVPPEASIVNEEGLERPRGVSNRMWRIIEQAMQPRRKDRPQNVTEFLALLDAKAVSAPAVKVASSVSEKTVIVPGPAPKPKKSPEPDGRKKSRNWLWVLLACAAVAAIVAAVVLNGRKDKPMPDGQLTAADTTVVSPAADPAASWTSDTSLKPEAEPEKPGNAKIVSTPSGATIWLDGRNTKKTTPNLLVDLKPGMHKVKLVLDGYYDYTGSITVTSGKSIDFSHTLEEKAKENPAPAEQRADQRAEQSSEQPAEQPAQQSSQQSPQQTPQQTPPVEKPTKGSINGHEWVDLGLSVKWATYNVGASSSGDYGSYFAWGEIKPKSEYEWENYRFRVTGDKWENVKFSKYNIDSSRGTVDNKRRLDMIDDAARQNWGGSWRMPTDAEWTELRRKCKWTWTIQGNKSGYEVTSKTNGNSIFLPAAGNRYSGLTGDAGSRGYYWSSSLCSARPFCAWYVYFNSSEVDGNDYYRRYGYSVRPVTE